MAEEPRATAEEPQQEAMQRQAMDKATAAAPLTQLRASKMEGMALRMALMEE